MDDINPTTHKRKSPTRSRAAKLAQAELAQGAREIKATTQAAIKRKRGQPTKYTPELWSRILEAVATYQDLIAICTQPDMPSVSTIYQWMRTDPQLKEDMRGAWEMFTMIGQSVNKNILSGGIMSSGDTRRDIEMAADNRWFMGKANRRDFGDRQQVEVTVQEPFVLEGWMLPGQKQDVIDVTPDEEA